MVKYTVWNDDRMRKGEEIQARTEHLRCRRERNRRGTFVPDPVKR